MFTLRRFFAVITLAFAVTAGASGCKQGAGERCQLDSDCECSSANGPDNKCVIVSGLEGLCCQGSGLVDASVADAGPTPDSSAGDASTD